MRLTVQVPGLMQHDWDGILQLYAALPRDRYEFGILQNLS